MINLSGISNLTLLGRALRVPLRLLPSGLVMPILQGPARGMRWIVGASAHGCWLGCYEVDKQRACARLVRPGMVVYDVGANVGFYSLLFSRLVGPTGSVHAFEPLPRNCELLRRHLALNRQANVVVHPLAVAEKSGTAGFDPATGPSMGRLVATAAFEVPTISLDEFVFENSQPAPDVVKMDVEGGERAVLAGMRCLLRDKRPVLLIALQCEEPRRNCIAMLAAARYRVADLAGRVSDGLPETDETIGLPA